MTSWFDVDKKGLAQLVERRGGKVWVLHELIANAWDEDTTRVDVQLVPEDGRPYVTLVVTDDSPDGFADLRHAWTLYASSKKKPDAGKRGVFDLGEKLVLALCEEAVIKTTTGAVLFDPRGRHLRNAWKTTRGTVFEGLVRMTRDELVGVRHLVKRLIPPAGITTTIDGVPLPTREPVAIVDATLPTVIGDADGQLRRTSRATAVRLYRPLPGEVAMIYEMGIPVVETGDALHACVQQRVPLNMERDNVTPAYLREVRAIALEGGHELLSDEDKAKPWVTEAMGHDAVSPAVVGKVLDSRFGANRVAADPSDREGEDIAKSRGMTIVHGGSLPGDVWAKVKAAGLIKPAGQVTPSPKPFHEGGTPLRLATAAERDQAAHGLRGYQYLGRKLLDAPVEVVLANDRGWPFAAAYSRNERRLTLNLARLGMEHFISPSPTEKMLALAIHEYAHHYESNHLAEGYHEACCRLGGKLAMLFAEIGGFGFGGTVWSEMIGDAS